MVDAFNRLNIIVCYFCWLLPCHLSILPHIFPPSLPRLLCHVLVHFSILLRKETWKENMSKRELLRILRKNGRMVESCIIRGDTQVSVDELYSLGFWKDLISVQRGGQRGGQLRRLKRRTCDLLAAPENYADVILVGPTWIIFANRGYSPEPHPQNWTMP